MKEAFIIPLKGLLVRDPISKNPLAEKGEVKPMSGMAGTYWKRRILDGSVAVSTPPKTQITVQPKIKRQDKYNTNKGD